jgi:4-hydroxybenzoate polyprenyltransferase
MNRLLSVFQWINILSIDVSLGAIVGCMFFAKYYNVEIPSIVLVALGLTVWVIYTVDRIFDVKDLKGFARSSRHLFHQKNKSTLLIFLSIAILCIAVLILFIPKLVIINGAELSVVVLIYILFNKRLYFLKEVFVASLYMAGILLPVYSLKSELSVLNSVTEIYFLLALANLIIFSWYEMEDDQAEGQTSIATLMSERKILGLLITLFILIFFLSINLFVYEDKLLIPSLIALMSLILFILLLFRKSLKPKAYYRILGDLIFIFPLAYILS